MPTDPALSNAAQDLGGYVFADETIAMFIQWTESANALSGTASFAQPDAASASGVKAVSVGFTGVRAGKQITFTVPFGSGAPTTWTGVLDVLSLAMYFPTTNGTISPLMLHPGTAADYNQAVLMIQQSALQQAAQARVAQATATAQVSQQAAVATAQVTMAQATADALNMQRTNVANANERLNSALRNLKSDTDKLARDTTFDALLQSYANHWTMMQEKDQTMRKDAAKQPLTCFQRNTVESEANSIEPLARSIQSDDASLQSIADRINTDLQGDSYSSGIKRDIQTAQTAFTALQTAVAANTTGAPSPQFTQDDVNNAVNVAQQQIDTSTAAMKGAQKQGADYDQKVAQLLKNAQGFVAGLKCS